MFFSTKKSCNFIGNNISMNSSEKSRSSAFPYRAMEHFQNKLFILYWKNAEPRKISFFNGRFSMG